MINDYKISLFSKGKPTYKQVKYKGSDYKIQITVNPKFNIKQIIFYYGNDEKVIKREQLQLSGSNTATAEFDAEDTGIYFFHFEVDTDCCRLFTSADKDMFAASFSGEKQILLVDNIYNTDFSYKGGIIYHIFVDRFYKYGEVPVRSDAEIIPDWENGIPEYTEKVGEFLKNNTFFGGTLYGIIEKLDYIKSLGTEIIYLSPIFKAYSNHKYDTADFMSVDEMFGGEEALKTLIEKCKEQQIKLILDGVFNHVGDDSIYFNRYGKFDTIGACQSESSPYRSWFTFNDKGYDCWWGIKNLPKINKNGDYVNFICNDVIKKYMSMGTDGWRLDVVDEYSNDFLEKIVASTKEQNPDAMIIGEVWDDVSNKTAYNERKSYFCGKALDSAMNYPLREGIIDFIKHKRNTKLYDIMSTQIDHYPLEKQLMMMNILGTHDTERIATVLGGEPDNGLNGTQLAYKKMTPEQKYNSKRLFMLAYELMAMLPGIPSIYYGDETGMEGYRDPFNRRPFPWHCIDNELVSFIKKINEKRKLLPAVINGDIQLLDTPVNIFAFKRIYKEHENIFVCNLSDNEYTVIYKNTEYKVNSNEMKGFI
ncbi:glycoside hydrolase family 13 protein [Eubacteriales bacterium OttesenSCG-928-G02]|nr:glycoside hydrolase family 13 protein [Eubacteriales bacterium OttesenSCG-928-G02]